MFKEKMYRELRDDMELYERAILERDWKLPQDDIEEPILCEFLRNENNKDTKNSTYTELKRIFLECKQGTNDRNSFFDKAEQICKNRKNSIAKDVKNLVKKVSTGEICADNFSEEEMELLKDALLRGILIAQAKAFLYDAGYPVENKRNTDKNKPVGNGIKRRQDSILELAELYLIKKGNGTFVNGAAADIQSKSFKEQSLKLFDAIRKGKCDKIFLPLYIDRNTGAGIYILGVNRLSKTVLVEGSRRWNRAGKTDWNKFRCHFTYIYWDEIIMGNDMEDSITLYAQACGDDIDTVIDIFYKNHELSYEAIAELNGRFIDGVEDAYRAYFSEDIVITDEDILEYKEKRMQDLARGIF